MHQHALHWDSIVITYLFFSVYLCIELYNFILEFVKNICVNLNQTYYNKSRSGCLAAKYLKVKSPIPYRYRKLMPQHVKYGMNFAFGGTGVFNTLVPLPNMTNQIDFLQQLIKDKVYSALDLTNSVALVSVAGNDYSHFLQTNGSEVNNFIYYFFYFF